MHTQTDTMSVVRSANINKQLEPVNRLCQLCVLSFRVEVK